MPGPRERSTLPFDGLQAEQGLVMVFAAPAARLCGVTLAAVAVLLPQSAFAQNSDPGYASVDPDLTPSETPDGPVRIGPPPLASAPTDTLPPLTWNWSQFSTVNYVIGATAGAVTLSSAIVKPRATHALSGGRWFDDDVRNALRVRSLSDRYIFRDASDVGLSLTVTWPFVADALTAAWWYRGSREVAEQMALIDLETLTISAAIQGVSNVLVSRERPYGRDCGSNELPSNASDCDGSSHYRSFFSQHSTLAFTGAALICVHHFDNELLGPPWDAISCAGGYAVAATTATFRVVSDLHYASDVITGALVGTLVGYGVPLLHYRNKNSLPSTQTGGPELHLIPSPGGLGLMGTF